MLDADPDTLITLVAVGIDGLGRDIWDATVGLASPTLPPDVATSEPDQALSFRAASIDVLDYYRHLSIASDESGIDDDTRWGAVRAVLDLAATTPPIQGSFITALEEGELSRLTVNGDEPAPDDLRALVDVVGTTVEAVLLANLYEEPAFRERLVGDVGLDTFAADPFVALLVRPNGGNELGQRVVNALYALLGADG